jgi:hypothetical protein
LKEKAYSRIRQTSTASPAEPGDLSLEVRMHIISRGQLRNRG